MFDGKEPVYLQIADYVRHQILTDVMGAGEQLLSTPQFSTAHKVNPATVARAYTILEEEGLVEKRRGIGVFVKEDAKQLLVERLRADFFSDRVTAIRQEAITLGIPLADVANYLLAEDSE